jgi:hypothetical protein
MFMSPSSCRRNGNKNKAEDENQLILNSPSSDGEANSILNGNDWTLTTNQQQQASSSAPDVGFVLPNVKAKKTPVSQVCTALHREQR